MAHHLSSSDDLQAKAWVTLKLIQLSWFGLLELALLRIRGIGVLLKVQDMDFIGVSIDWSAVLGLKLVVEALESSVSKVTNRDGAVTLLLADLLEVVQGVLILPVADDLDVSLTAHVDVLVHGPVELLADSLSSLCFLLSVLVHMLLLLDGPQLPGEHEAPVVGGAPELESVVVATVVLPDGMALDRIPNHLEF